MLRRLSASGAFRSGRSITRSLGFVPEKTIIDDSASKTSINTILDRTAYVFFMTDIWRALWLCVETTLKPKVTINYPHEKGPISTRFRGEHLLRRYPSGEERCIACKLCEAICPAQVASIALRCYFTLTIIFYRPSPSTRSFDQMGAAELPATISI